jgi:Domain of unknown function (DUF1841)
VLRGFGDNVSMSSQPQRRPSDPQRFVADASTLSALHLTLDDLADADTRALVIRHEHPEFVQALGEDRSEIDVGGESINVRLHIAIHEIVATQLWEDEPPEVWETAVRLLSSGYERHEILHMLGRPVADQIWRTLHDERPYDRDRHAAQLAELPGSWEQERLARTVARRHADARKRARRAAGTTRRRTRRPR